MSAEDGRIPSAVRKSIEPLVAWYRANKPEVKHLTLTADDYDRLLDASSSTLARNEFRRAGTTLMWRDYELRRK